MKIIQQLNRIPETMIWGAVFFWWGIALLFDLPNGMDALGIGLILLGVVAVRALSGLATNFFSILFGILVLAWGVLDLARSVFSVPLGVSEFAILLIVLGTTLFVRALVRTRGTDFENAAR